MHKLFPKINLSAFEFVTEKGQFVKKYCAETVSSLFFPNFAI